MPAVRVGEQVPVEDHLRRPRRDDAAVDERGLLEALRRADQVVGRGDDGLAGPRLALEHVHQLFLGRRVDPGHRLVEEVQLRLGGDRPGEEHPPPLAARQRADLAIERAGHPDGLERGVDPVPVVATTAGGRSRAGRSGPSSRPRRRSPGTPSRPPRPGARRRSSRARVHRRRRRGPRRCRENGASSPAMTLRSVLLPAPFGPMTASSEPRRTSSVDVGEGDPAAVAGGDADETDGGTAVERRRPRRRGRRGPVSVGDPGPRSERSSERVDDLLHVPAHHAGIGVRRGRPEGIVVEGRDDLLDARLLGEGLGELRVELGLARTPPCTPAALTFSTRAARSAGVGSWPTFGEDHADELEAEMAGEVRERVVEGHELAVRRRDRRDLRPRAPRRAP